MIKLISELEAKEILRKDETFRRNVCFLVPDDKGTTYMNVFGKYRPVVSVDRGQIYGTERFMDKMKTMKAIPFVSVSGPDDTWERLNVLSLIKNDADDALSYYNKSYTSVRKDDKNFYTGQYESYEARLLKYLAIAEAEEILSAQVCEKILNWYIEHIGIELTLPIKEILAV